MSAKDFHAQNEGGFPIEYLRATWLAEYYDGDESHPEVTQILGEYDDSDPLLEFIDSEEEAEEETVVRHSSDVPLEDEG